MTRTALTSGETAVGEAIVCTDVTRVERQRRQLKQQNEQLDEFAEAITHELRNLRGIADGYLDLLETDQSEEANVATARITGAHERMERVVGDLSTLARRGRAVEYVEPCSLDAVVEAGRREAATDGLTAHVEGEATMLADRSLASEFFTNVCRFATLHDADGVVVQPDDDRIVITIRLSRLHLR